MKFKNFFDKHLVLIICFCGVMLLGLFYPSIIKNKMQEVLLNGTDGELVTIGIIGTIFFVVSGIMAQRLIVAILREKNPVSTNPLALFTAVLFGIIGASYNAIAIMNRMENDFGLLGSYAIEENNLGFIKPLSTVLIIISIVLLVYLLLRSFKSDKTNNRS